MHATWGTSSKCCVITWRRMGRRCRCRGASRSTSPAGAMRLNPNITGRSQPTSAPPDETSNPLAAGSTPLAAILLPRGRGLTLCRARIFSHPGELTPCRARFLSHPGELTPCRTRFFSRPRESTPLLTLHKSLARGSTPSCSLSESGRAGGPPGRCRTLPTEPPKPERTASQAGPCPRWRQSGARPSLSMELCPAAISGRSSSGWLGGLTSVARESGDAPRLGDDCEQAHASAATGQVSTSTAIVLFKSSAQGR
jgi:hypothetical protein